MADISFTNCLEIGCGTGKNTEWLVKKAAYVTAVDFSEEMLAKAKQKIMADNVIFYQADITHSWSFADSKYDLITFSLVLEHIEHLSHVFHNTSNVIRDNGYLYIGELHPFKQYSGTKARFESVDGRQTVTCFTHHISDFIKSACNFGFKIVSINEYFDEGNKASPPRIFSILLRKESGR